MRSDTPTLSLSLLANTTSTCLLIHYPTWHIRGVAFGIIHKPYTHAARRRPFPNPDGTVTKGPNQICFVDERAESRAAHIGRLPHVGTGRFLFDLMVLMGRGDDNGHCLETGSQSSSASASPIPLHNYFFIPPPL